MIKFYMPGPNDQLDFGTILMINSYKLEADKETI